EETRGGQASSFAPHYRGNCSQYGCANMVWTTEKAEAIAAWNTRTAAQPEREAVLEEAAMIVDQFASGRRYCEPTEWDYGAQDALVRSPKSVGALRATCATAVSTDEIVAVREGVRDAMELLGNMRSGLPAWLKLRDIWPILSRLRGEGE